MSLSSVTLSQTRKDREQSETHKKRNVDDENFSELSYRSNKRANERDKISVVSRNSKREAPIQDEMHSSSEEEKEDDFRKKSPCKSYVTQLTDISRMTSEQ